MDQRDMKELWLQEHAIECPVHTARISLEQCLFFRSLPYEGNKCNIGPRVMHMIKLKNKRRDIACDSCTAWKAKDADPGGKSTRESTRTSTIKQLM
jgi:hypothetical protein